MHLDWAWGWFTEPPTSVWGLDEDTWFLVIFFNCYDGWWYCWWKKSCTSWYGKYPIIYRVLYIRGGAGFRPSTVSCEILQVNRFMACDIYDLIEYNLIRDFSYIFHSHTSVAKVPQFPFPMRLSSIASSVNACGRRFAESAAPSPRSAATAEVPCTWQWRCRGTRREREVT